MEGIEKCTNVGAGHEASGSLAPLGPPLAEAGVEHDELPLALRLVVRAHVHVRQYVGPRPFSRRVHQVYRERVQEGA